MGAPLFVRTFIRDAIEGGVTALLALNVAIPGNLDQAKAEALIIGTAIGGAVVAVARRELPGFFTWLGSVLTPEDAPVTKPDGSTPPSGAGTPPAA